MEGWLLSRIVLHTTVVPYGAHGKSLTLCVSSLIYWLGWVGLLCIQAFKFYICTSNFPNQNVHYFHMTKIKSLSMLLGAVHFFCTCMCVCKLYV